MTVEKRLPDNNSSTNKTVSAFISVQAFYATFDITFI